MGGGRQFDKGSTRIGGENGLGDGIVAMRNIYHDPISARVGQNKTHCNAWLHWCAFPFR